MICCGVVGCIECVLVLVIAVLVNILLLQCWWMY